MTFSTFRNAVLSGFQTGFTVARPTFPTANILWGRTSKTPPNNETYIRVVYADLDGDFFAVGSRDIEQNALFTVDVYVPEVVDLNEVELIATDVLEVIKFLVLPNNGRKTRLGKRDFANSLGGFAHSRVSVTFVYDA